MPTLLFKGKTAVECPHHAALHSTLEYARKLSVFGTEEKSGRDGNPIIEGDTV